MVAGILLIFASISVNSNIMSFVDAPSLIITLVGSFCALLISFPFNTLKKVPALLKKLMFTPEDDLKGLIDRITELARKSRTEGILSIESEIQELSNPLLIHGLEMVVDGTDIDTIENILNIELDQMEDRHSVGHEVFLKWGEYAPAFGMIGTLIGLIAMLGDLQDPSLIGSGMATALITTFYGSFLANLIFLPIAKNLEVQTANELKANEMIVEGVLALQRGDNPRVIEQKLSSYLSQKEKQVKDDKEDLEVAEELTR